MHALGLAQIEEESATPRMALISVLPPNRTGLASYALNHFGDPRWEVDHYAPFNSPAELQDLVTSHGSRSRRFFSLTDLGRIRPASRYRALIFQIGNSPHHIPALRALRVAPALPEGWIYLHEAQLSRFWLPWCGDDPRQMRMLYREHYPDHLITMEDLLGASGDGDTPRGIRPLLALTGCSRIIVNSACCEELVRRDLGTDFSGRILRLFLPIPAYKAPPERKSGPLRVGHFGGIGTGKGVPLLLEALRRIRADRAAILVLAGYDARRWAKRHGLAQEDWVEVLDAPSEEMLLEAMGSVDVAVQLRPVTHGESSGVVSHLLGLGRNVIVTGIDAFLDYGDAVGFVAPNVDASTLAGRILDESAQDRSRALDQVRQDFSRAAFHDRLWKGLGED